MGFSSSLQGDSAHEALLTRQDAELRLLENMKRCITLRVKCDREYSIALNSVVLQAQKMDKDGQMAGSLVAQCWSTFIDESEKIVKIVKDNADFLASNTLEILNNLFLEKRNNRKTYHEEQSRVCGELHKLQEGVAKTRAEYEKCLESHASSKVRTVRINPKTHMSFQTRYEEQKSKGSKRVEEFKDRYQKSCKK